MGSIRLQSSIIEIFYLFIRKHRIIIICLFNRTTLASPTIASLTGRLQAILLYNNPTKATLNRSSCSRLPEVATPNI